MRSALLTPRRPVPVTPRPGDAARTANDPSSRRVRRDRGLLLGAGTTVLLVVLVVSAAAPPAALGGIPTPFGLNPLKGLGDTITGGFGSMAVEAFDAIVKHLFAPVNKLVTAQLIGWLVAIPDFTGGHVRQLQTTIVAMGGALLGAVATLAIVRYWLVGLAGDGFGALEGLARTVAAALALAMWPWAFTQAVELTNLFTRSLLSADSVVTPCAELLLAGLGSAIGLGLSPFGLFLGLLIAAAASVLFLCLLLLKVAMTVSTLLVFFGMPLAIVLWPVAPSVPAMIGRAFLVCLAVPVAWAICFATSAVIVLDSLRFTGGGSVMDKLLKPLVAIVLLYIMVKLPTGLARMAMVGRQALRGGFVSETAGYTARRRASNAVEERLDESHRSHRRSASGEHDAYRERTRARPGIPPAGATKPHPASGSGRGAGGGGGPSPNGGSGPAGYTPPPSPRARATGQETQRGLPTPAFRKDDFEAEMFEAEHRERNNPVSLDQARTAVQALPADAQPRIAATVGASSGDGARRELAYRATAGEWTADEREALRTLAAAAPDVRGQALTILYEGSGSAPASPGGGPLPAPPESAPFDYGREASSEQTAGREPGGDSGAAPVPTHDQRDPGGGSGASPRPLRDKADPGASTSGSSRPPRQQRDPGGSTGGSTNPSPEPRDGGR
jgi:hypothetical protein